MKAGTETEPQNRSSESPPARLSIHVRNVAIIVIAITALFWRVFFLGETLIDVATLNNQLPWGYDAGPSDYPYNRRDLTDMYVTREYFVVAAYRDGEFPLWNPYTMAGHPIYADGVTRTLSPFLLFYKFFDVPLGYSLARIFELALGAVFMYIFLIAIGAGPRGSLVGSLVFGLSAHSMLHLTGLGWWGGLMWLPLIFLFCHRAVARASFTQATLAGVFLAVQFFCGYLPNQIYYVGAVALYFLFFAYRRRGEARREVLRPLALLCVTLGVGMALSASQWVPMLELLRHSNRRIVGAELGYIYLPPWYALTLLLPNVFGAAYDAKALTLFTALGVSHDHILYISVAGLLLLGFSVHSYRRGLKDHPGLAFFMLLAVVSLLIMTLAPVYVPVTRFIPILQVIRVAVRAGVLFLFAACVLVAFGADRLFEASRELVLRFVGSAQRWLMAVGAFVLVAVAASYLVRATGFAQETTERGRVAFLRRAALLLSHQFTPPAFDIIFPLVIFFGLVMLLRAYASSQLSPKVLFTIIVVFVVADLCWQSGQFNQTFERSRVYPQTQITDLLRTLPTGRVLVVPSDLESNRRVSGQSADEKIIAPPNTLLPYRVPVVSGKNQQFPRWYREYASLIEPQPNLSHVVFDEPRSPFFDLLDVRYVMTHASRGPLEGYRLIATAEGISVYENPDALPRAFFARHVIGAAGPAESLAAMRDPSFDPRSDVVIEGEPRPAAAGTAEIVEDRRNSVTINTESDGYALLVLSDNYYPGWRVTVDGARAEVLRANHTMRAVAVPPGRHVVSFVFAPVAFWASVYASIAAGALVLVTLAFAVVRRRSSSRYTGR